MPSERDGVKAIPYKVTITTWRHLWTYWFNMISLGRLKDLQSFASDIYSSNLHLAFVKSSHKE